MKKWVGSVALVAALLAGSYAWANCGSCGAKKDGAKATTASGCQKAGAETAAAKCSPDDCFKSMDANSDGNIDKAEFTAAMPKMAAAMKAGAGCEAACGAKAKATVAAAEGGCPKAAAKARLTGLVSSFDANGNGKLCGVEMGQARATLTALLKASGPSGCCPSAAKAKDAKGAKEAAPKEVSIDEFTIQAMKVMDEQAAAEKSASAGQTTGEPVAVTAAK